MSEKFQSVFDEILMLVPTGEFAEIKSPEKDSVSQKEVASIC